MRPNPQGYGVVRRCQGCPESLCVGFHIRFLACGGGDFVHEQSAGIILGASFPPGLPIGMLSWSPYRGQRHVTWEGGRDKRTGGGDKRTGGGDKRTGGGDKRTRGGDSRSADSVPISGHNLTTIAPKQVSYLMPKVLGHS